MSNKIKYLNLIKLFKTYGLFHFFKEFMYFIFFIQSIPLLNTLAFTIKEQQVSTNFFNYKEMICYSFVDVF